MLNFVYFMKEPFAQCSGIFVWSSIVGPSCFDLVMLGIFLLQAAVVYEMGIVVWYGALFVLYPTGLLKRIPATGAGLAGAATAIVMIAMAMNGLAWAMLAGWMAS
jgi:hypothetical protein